MRIRSFVTTTLLLCATAAPALAQTPPPVSEEPTRGSLGFVEIYGNWGVNFGRTQFVPDGAPGSSKYPFAQGFGGGAAAGIVVLPDWLSVMVEYRYGHTDTISGNLDNALDQVHGELSYHALTAGVRMEHPLWCGSAYAQMTGGVLFPFQARLEFEYAPQLAAIGITGSGRMEENYGWAYGAQAELGYHYNLPSRLYVGLGLRVAAFQASNNGRDTNLINFVTDFTARPPVATSATIHHSTGGGLLPTNATPETYSVQDVRLNLSVGYRF